MGYVKVYTQADLDRVLREGVDVPELFGDAEFTLYGNATARLYDNATARLYDNATARLYDNATATLYDNATATLYDNATARLYDNATATLSDNATATLSDNATATLYDNATARLARYAVAHILSDRAEATGGTIIRPKPAESPQDWGEINLADPHEDGSLVLYKAVRDDFRSSRGLLYEPGGVPVAPDWDGGKAECGGGLHFCAHPALALTFDPSATRFMACPVALEDMAVVSNPDYPNKIKARGCCAPIWEVDIDGKRVEGEGE